jgi:hypothetical protein
MKAVFHRIQLRHLRMSCEVFAFPRFYDPSVPCAGKKLVAVFNVYHFWEQSHVHHLHIRPDDTDRVPVSLSAFCADDVPTEMGDIASRLAGCTYDVSSWMWSDSAQR